MRRIKNYKKLNNRGVAMISIMIAVAFITVIASALLYITYTNFSMKTMNLRSKENFYEIDGQINKVSAGTRNVLNGTTSENPTTNIAKLTASGVAPTKDVPQQYDVRNFVYMAHPVLSHFDAYTDKIGNQDAATDPAQYSSFVEGESVSWSMGANEIIRSDAESINDDRFSYYTEYGANATNGMITVEEDTSTGATKYTFHNLCIEERAAGGYVNRIKTDIEIITVKTTGSGEEGGIGEFSCLSDSSLKVDGGTFTVLDIYGNAFFSNTDGTGSYLKSDSTTATFTKPGTAAVVLNKESKLNLIGQYMVVYGDIVLNDSSCLYIGSGNLTVYGDIVINDNATLICNGKIYMVDGKLPGREQSEIKYSGTKEQHIYPASAATPSKLTKAQFEQFCNTLKYDDSNVNNDGIMRQIMKDVTVDGYTFNLCDYNGCFDSLQGSTRTTYYGQSIAVHINDKNTDTLNNTIKNMLLFNTREDVQIREANPYTTIITNKAVRINQQHSISLTKIGDDVFDWLTKTSKTDSNADPKVHDFQIIVKPGSGEKKGKISTADFFVNNPNEPVKKMLRQATGGGSGSDSYYSSIRLLNYVKDYE